MERDFIISSLFNISERETSDFPNTVFEVTHFGTRLVDSHRFEDLVDLSRLSTALHRTLFYGETQFSPMTRGIIVARTLEQLEIQDAGALAADFAHALTFAQLECIASSGLLALRLAMKTSNASARHEHVLQTIEHVLEGRAPIEASDAGGFCILVEGWGVSENEARKVLRLAMPELRGRLGGSVVIALAKEEQATSPEVVREHYRRCAEVLSPAIRQSLSRASQFERVRFVPQHQLMPARQLTWMENALAVWTRVDALMIRPIRDRMFVPAEN